MISIKQMIRTGAATLCAVCLLSACSSTLDEAIDGDNTAQALTNIQIGDFPAFGSEANNGTQTRSAAIGTYDKGKTEWENGDEILLKITDSKSEVTTATLVYKGTKWAPSAALELRFGSATIEAHYAPAYEWSNNVLALKAGKSAGTEEYLSYSGTQTIGNTGVTITFGSRNYSRLRVATAPDMTVTLIAANFTTNDGTTTAENGIIATADEKGNAYFYGSWTETASLKITTNVDSQDWTLAEKTTTAATTQGNSYALNAIPATYNAIGAGTAESPYHIYNATQLQDINSAEKKQNVDNTYYQDGYFNLEADIDCSDIQTFMPIGYTESRENNCAYFQGFFDGKGYTISNLNLGIANYNGNKFSGLFGSIYTSNATIKNVTLRNPKIEATILVVQKVNCAGSLIGAMYGGSVYNCHVIADSDNSFVKATSYENTDIGGLIGMVGNSWDPWTSSVIVACSSSINVQGSTQRRIGGLIGYGKAYNNSLKLVACYATGKITNNNTDTTVYGNVGGLIGMVLDDALSCYADVTFVVVQNSNVGGIAGVINGYKASYCATTSQLGTVGAGTNGNGATSTGICNDGGTGTPTVTGCFGGIAQGEIYGKLTVDGAETQWATIRDGITTQLPELAGKSLKDLWKNNAGALPTLNIRADGTVGE